jgi:hypothetical protein
MDTDIARLSAIKYVIEQSHINDTSQVNYEWIEKNIISPLHYNFNLNISDNGNLYVCMTTIISDHAFIIVVDRRFTNVFTAWRVSLFNGGVSVIRKH